MNLAESVHCCRKTGQKRLCESINFLYYENISFNKFFYNLFIIFGPLLWCWSSNQSSIYDLLDSCFNLINWHCHWIYNLIHLYCLIEIYLNSSVKKSDKIWHLIITLGGHPSVQGGHDGTYSIWDFHSVQAFDGWWYDPFFFEWVTTSHDVV